MGGNERLPEHLSREPAERAASTSGRKRAGAGPREQTEFVRRALDALNHPFYVIDARDYTIRLANAAARLGPLPAGATCYEVTHGFSEPCGGEEYTCPLEEVKKTRAPVTVEHVHRDRDGCSRVYEVHCHPILDSGGNVDQVIEYSLDITERKRAEAALRESEARYHGLVEHIPAIVYVAALDEGSTTLYISPQVESLLGISPVEWTTHPELFVEQLHPRDRERVLADLAVTHGNGEPFVSEYRLLARDGSVRWFHDEAVVIRGAAGEPLVLQGVMLDITERKRAEEALRVSEERLHTVVTNAPVILFAIDREGVVTLSEGKGLEPLGLEPDEVVGRSVFDTYSDTPEIIENVRRALAGETFTATARVMGLAFETQYAPLRNEDGQVAGVIAVATDVTERTRAEEALRKAREELEIRVERLMQAGDPYGLTFRELTVLHLVAAGRADKQIGGELGISALTVNKHVAHILSKMGAASRTEAGVRAIREGLLG